MKNFDWMGEEEEENPFFPPTEKKRRESKQKVLVFSTFFLFLLPTGKKGKSGDWMEGGRRGKFAKDKSEMQIFLYKNVGRRKFSCDISLAKLIW